MLAVPSSVLEKREEAMAKLLETAPSDICPENEVAAASAAAVFAMAVGLGGTADAT